MSVYTAGNLGEMGQSRGCVGGGGFVSTIRNQIIQAPCPSINNQLISVMPNLAALLVDWSMVLHSSSRPPQLFVLCKYTRLLGVSGC